MVRILFLSFFVCVFCACCGRQHKFSGAAGEVRLMTLDPGHFHAALVQKAMYPRISPIVSVFAPEGADLEEHLKRIRNFNSRPENPTQWQERVYVGADYMQKMLALKPGNVVVISGNNRKKTEYIRAAIDADIHVLSDKPMCIDSQDFELLKTAIQTARDRNILLYDIMTERYEIATMLQKEIVNDPAIFGELQQGSEQQPAIIKESVHHLFKYVSGVPLKRPAWFLDTAQQGEGIVDVTTHLVDLVMWECFPQQSIDYQTQIDMISAKHWPTLVNREQFLKVSGLNDFPDFLRSRLNSDGALPVYCNGEMSYKLRGCYTTVSVTWEFEAPEGGGDSHFSVIRGSQAHVIIRQGKEQNYVPTLYIEAAPDINAQILEEKLLQKFPLIQKKYPGIELAKDKQGWSVVIPSRYHVGHEAHFGQVTEKFLQYLLDGKLPDWEVQNMIAKYYTTTKALAMAVGAE